MALLGTPLLSTREAVYFILAALNMAPLLLQLGHCELCQDPQGIISIVHHNASFVHDTSTNTPYECMVLTNRF